MKQLFPWLVSGFALGLDQWLKATADSGSQAHLGGIFFRLYKNSGLVFSIPAPGVIIVGLTMMACVLILWMLWSRRHDRWTQWPAALFAAGAVSNLGDRLWRGYVVDYFYVGDRAPIINIADVMLFVALVMMLWPRKALTVKSPTV